MMACFGLRRRTKARGDSGVRDSSPQPRETVKIHETPDNFSNDQVFSFRSSQEALQLLCTLQRELCNLQSKAIESRASAMVDVVQGALSASVVRLYGVSEEHNRGGSATLVLLGTATATGPREGTLADDDLGECLEVPLETQPQGGCGPAGTNRGSTRRCNGPQPGDLPSLLQRSILSMAPALYSIPLCAPAATPRASREVATGKGAAKGAAAEGPAEGADMNRTLLPSDCLSDHTTHGSSIFTALPLVCGTKLLGVLWISVAGVGSPVRQLMCSMASLQQLALSASVALTSTHSGPDGQPYICWLAAALARVAGSPTLQALVLELNGTVDEHVRQRYLLELSVHTALIPSSSSSVAYMLASKAGAGQQSVAAPAISAGGMAVSSATAISCSNLANAAGRQRRSCISSNAERNSPMNSSMGRRDAGAQMGGFSCPFAAKGGGGTITEDGEVASTSPLTAGAAAGRAARPTPGWLPPSGAAVSNGRGPANSQQAATMYWSASQENLPRAAVPHASSHSVTGRRTGPEVAAAALPHLRPVARSHSSVHQHLEARQALHEEQVPLTPLEPVLTRTASQVVQLHTPNTSCQARPGVDGAGNIADAAVRELALALAAGGSTAPSLGECGGMLGTMQNGVGNFSVALLGTLKAKAFKLSHTLLQRVIDEAAPATDGANLLKCNSGSVTDVGGKKANGGSVDAAVAANDAKSKVADVAGAVAPGATAAAVVAANAACALPGIVVPDCSHWVQDVRRPSRDLFLLMLGPSASHGNLLGSSDILGSNAQARASASAVQSLVLVCLEISRSTGVFLGLYLCFPSRMPAKLLEAIRISCSELLHTVLGRVVQAKLRDELSAEVDTLRLGVPGSYAVVPSLMVSGSFSQTGTAVRAGDRGDDATAGSSLSCHDNRPPTVSGTMVNGFVAGGEVRPPGRLARTVTMTQLEATCGGSSFSGNSTSEDHFSTSYATATGTADGADATTAAGPAELISDLDINLDLAALKNTGRRTANLPVNNPASVRAIQTGCESAKRPSLLGMVDGLSLSGLLVPALSPGLASARLSRRHKKKLGAASSLSGPSPSVKLVDPPLSGALNTTAVEGGGAGGTPGALPAPVLMTVHGTDGSGNMRAHLGILVESLLGTIRSTAAMTASIASAEASQATTTAGPITRGTHRSIGAAACNAEDLNEIQLYDILGEGASGVVLRGIMGTVPVATKLIEVPQLDEPDDKEGHTADTAVAAGPAEKAAAAEKANKDNLCARHTMYRNAMELAVLRSTTHVNIVQCLGVFDNVVLEHMQSPTGMRGCVLRKADAVTSTGAAGSPICTAIVTELCDSSLATVLGDRTFPRMIFVSGPTTSPPGSQPMPGKQSGGSTEGSCGTGEQNRNEARTRYKYDMQGVYLTVLEIALALRHLHSRRLVHRDVKPANVLLKTSPSDPRGWITKLADFGFTLLLERQDWNLSENTGACSQQAAAAAAAEPQRSVSGAALRAGFASNSSSHIAGSSLALGEACTFYTVQEQACGTVTHMAPEAMRPHSRIDASADVYSLGVLMWDILAGRGYRPYRELSPDQVPPAVMGGLRPVFPDWAPASYRKLAEACWSAEPQRRPTAAEVVAAVKVELEMMQLSNSSSSRHQAQNQQLRYQQQQQQRQLAAHGTANAPHAAGSAGHRGGDVPGGATGSPSRPGDGRGGGGAAALGGGVRD